MPKKKKLALKLGIQAYQILTNDDEVCVPILSSILLAVLHKVFHPIVSPYFTSIFHVCTLYVVKLRLLIHNSHKQA